MCGKFSLILDLRHIKAFKKAIFAGGDEHMIQKKFGGLQVEKEKLGEEISKDIRTMN